MMTHTPTLTIAPLKNMTHYIILGNGIDAVTTAVVLATLGNQIQIYHQKQQLQNTLEKYSFEHQLMALWQLYINQGRIELSALPNQADDRQLTWQQLAQASIFQTSLVNRSVEAIWWFIDDAMQSCEDSLANQNRQTEQNTDDTDELVIALNSSEQQSAAIILSGKQPIGYFHQLSKRLNRPWVYYVPFVFLQEGQAYHSMLYPSLWLLGEKTADSWQRISVFAKLQHHATQSDITNIKTIEFARSAIMAMLATRVSYMNEMSRLADAHQIDVSRIRHIMGLDSRIGASYLQAGWGFGGRTLPIEMQLIKQSFQNTHTDSQLISAVDAINEDQKELIFRKFWQHFDGLIDNKTVMIWGGSYKSGSGRTQNSAIHPLLRLLWSYGIKTLVYADKASEELRLTYLQSQQPPSLLPKLTLLNHPYESIEQAHALFVMSWDNAQSIQIAYINEVAIPVFDAQNCLTTEQIAQLVGDYVGMGRQKNSINTGF